MMSLLCHNFPFRRQLSISVSPYSSSNSSFGVVCFNAKPYEDVSVFHPPQGFACRALNRHLLFPLNHLAVTKYLSVKFLPRHFQTMELTCHVKCQSHEAGSRKIILKQILNFLKFFRVKNTPMICLKYSNIACRFILSIKKRKNSWDK